MRPPERSTTKLPKQLLNELGEPVRAPENRPRRAKASRNLPSGRKERRKFERDQKKERKRIARPQRPSYGLEDDIPSSSDESMTETVGAPPRKAPQAIKPGKAQAELPKSILKKPARDDHRQIEFVERSPSPSRPLSRRDRDKLAQDDQEIADLEKKLGIKGRKKLPKSFDEDGLGLLLDGLDEAGIDDSRTDKKRKRTTEEEWLHEKRQKTQGVKNDTREDEDIPDGSISSGSTEPDDLSNTDDQDEGPEDEFEGFESDESLRSPPPKQRENPYIAPSTSSTTSTSTKYTPPSLRNPSASETESLTRLRRQLQGLLNRLSEANLISILNEVEQLYRQNPRQHVTSTLIDLLIGLICDRSGLMDTFLILHAGFIAAVYRVSGMDIGAMAVQRIVEEFDRLYDPLESIQDRGGGTHVPDSKEVSNLMSLISELYNFQTIGSQLVFDFVRLFLNSISETNTELLLRIIKNCGPQLRQDDPSALKEIVLMLQPAIAKTGEGKLSVRTKFMIETINNLKNNRMKTGAAASAVTSEATMRMKKLLGSLNSRSLRASEPLRVGLRDIRDTDKKGKWWLVGASWKGDANKEGNDEPSLSTYPPGYQGVVERQICSADGGTTDLLRLAREQRMNTDIRRAVFITIMSSSDHQDAYLRLMKLRLKRAQESEIPRVLIHCAGAEQVYNPYYTVIARKLCGEHKMRMAFQFGLWDLFKRMGEGADDDEIQTSGMIDEEDEDRQLGMRPVVNFAKLYGTLIADGGLTLSVLKKLNFTYLQPKTQTFAELLLVTIILRCQRPSESSTESQKTLTDLFLLIRDDPTLARGLQFFLRKVVMKTDVIGGKLEKERVRRGCKVANNALTEIATSSKEEVDP
ncbi:MAG: suppressor of glycerol defect [Sclerophora amabilis]|nr:MAG: suppressor of glycerol defect [Sclerophora amabilis]